MKVQRICIIKSPICVNSLIRQFTNNATQSSKLSIKEFFNIIKKGFNDLFRNPLLIIPGLLLWLFIYLFSRLSVVVNHILYTTSSLIAWLVFFSFVSLIAMAFVFSGLIKISKEIIENSGNRIKFFPEFSNGQFSKINNVTKRIAHIHKKKINARDFFSNGKRFWFRSFLILLFLLFVGIVIWAIANYGGIYAGKLLDLEVNAATLLYILIYFAGLVGILIFLTFSNVCLVVGNLNFREAVKKSIKLVKKEYLAALALNVLIFVILFLLNKVNGIWIDLIEYALLIPLFVLILTRFVLHIETRK